MVKVNTYTYAAFRFKKAQDEINSKNVFEKMFSAIGGFFGFKTSSTLNQIIGKGKFYKKNLQSYQYKEGFLSILTNFFNSKKQLQEKAIKKENLFKNKIYQNMAFIKQETANCKAATGVKKGKPATLLINLSTTTDLEEMVERTEELKRELEKLTKEVSMYPELIANSSQTEFKQLKTDINQALSDLNEIRNQCSSNFINQIYDRMKSNLKELKTAESPEEKQAVKEKMIRTELYVQSKGFLINEQDRKFLNEVITVADYLVELAPKGGLLNFNDILKQIHTAAINEIRDLHIAEIGEIDDLDVLERAVLQIDRRVDKLTLQMEFTAELMDEETHLDFIDDLHAVKDDFTAALDDVIKERIERNLTMMNGFNTIENRNTEESNQRFFELKNEVLPAINRLHNFVEFLGDDFIPMHSPSLQSLEDEIDYKEWLIKNANLLPLAQSEEELFIGMGGCTQVQEEIGFPLYAKSQETPLIQELLDLDALPDDRFELNDLKAELAKLKNLLNATKPDEFVREEIDFNSIEEATLVQDRSQKQELDSFKHQLATIKGKINHLPMIDNQLKFSLEKIEIYLELSELVDKVDAQVTEIKKNEGENQELLEQAEALLSEQEHLLDDLNVLNWQQNEREQYERIDEPSHSLSEMAQKISGKPRKDMLLSPVVTCEDFNIPYETEEYPFLIQTALKDLKDPQTDFFNDNKIEGGLLMQDIMAKLQHDIYGKFQRET